MLVLHFTKNYKLKNSYLHSYVTFKDLFCENNPCQGNWPKVSPFDSEPAEFLLPEIPYAAKYDY